MWRVMARDHPRSRGVYRLIRVKARLIPGSSPLARGLPILTLAVLLCSGIIPARAGFTGVLAHYLRNIPDHPRSRGVYAWILTPTERLQGSSPLARGLLKNALEKGEEFGIIPARAGFTGDVS